MVKRFVETVPIVPQNLSTGVVQGQLSLADRLEGFKQSTEAFQARIGTRLGQTEAAQVPIETTTVSGQEVTVAPKPRKLTIKDFLLFNGTQTQSFNQTLRAGYLASLSNDNREAVANIMLDNPDNVLAFNEAIGGYAKGVLQGVEPSVRPIVAAQLDSLTTDARIRVFAASQARLADEANSARADVLITLKDAGIRAARENDQIAAAEANVEYGAFVQTMVDDGSITQRGADVMVADNVKSVAAENLLSAVRRESQTEGGIARAAEALLTFRDAPLRGFSVDEQQALYLTMVSELNQTLNLKNKLETDEEVSINTAQELNSSNLYIGVLDGSVVSGDITLALVNKEVTQQQASTLINILNSRGAGVDDFNLINQITESIRNNENPNVIRQAINDNTGDRLTGASSNELTSLLNTSLDVESPLKANRVRRAESFIVQSMRVTGPFGALDIEAEQRLAIAKREFSNAVLAGEDPWIVADTLVDKDAFIRAPNPMFGSKEDLKGSLDALNSAFDAGTIAEDDYNFQFNQLQKLIELKTTLDNFESERKDALSGR